MHDLIQHIRSHINPPMPDISHYRKEGSALGSNPGGVFVNPNTNQKHYVKFYSNPQQASSEMASSQIYNALGAKTLGQHVANYKGHTALVSKWNPELDRMQEKDFQKLDNHQQNDLARHFHAAVLTKNWDSVGLEHDNIMNHSSGFHTVDTGGTFEFRAQGGHKDYGSDISEWDSLRNPNMNRQSHSVFKHLTSEHLNSVKPELEKLNYDQVHSIMKNSGMQHADKHAATLMKRRNAILAKLG